MAKIFISYRRDDSAYATGVIRDQLAARLPGCEIFFDVDSIPYGVNFRHHLESSVAACDFLVAVIGKRWLTAQDSQGQRRLDNPDDAVRVEVETALRRKIPLIPVFLDAMPVPTPDELPESLRELVSRNAIFVRPPPDFNNDIAKLVHSFERWLGQELDADQQAISVPQAVIASPLRDASRRKWLGLAAILVAVAVGGWWISSPLAGPPDYDFGESYLFEDSDPKPAAWQARTRMLDGGFKLPVEYVHWVVPVTHANNLQPTIIPVDCRLLDTDGEVVKFSGLAGELPDEKYPHSGKSEWIFTFGSRNRVWKPGKYTLQLGTPTKAVNTSFEIFAP